MTVLIESVWPYMGVDLANFVTDSPLLLPRHEDWLKGNIAFILRRNVKVEMRLIGGASQTGDARWNRELSQARINAVVQEVEHYPCVDIALYCPDRLTHRNPTGERLAAGRTRGSNMGRSRAVGLQIWPWALSPYQTTRSQIQTQTEMAINAYKTAFKQISTASFPTGVRGLPLQGENLVAAWEPVHMKMLGFGRVVRNLIRGNVGTNLQQPGMYFLDAVKLTPSSAVTNVGTGHLTEGSAHSRGQTSDLAEGARLAKQVWINLHPNMRWGLRYPDTELALRRLLASHFKKAFDRCFNSGDRFGGGGATSRMHWTYGMSEFYGANEERQNPLLPNPD